MSGIFGSGNYQQVGGNTAFRKYDAWDAGDQVAGKLVEVRKDKFGKPAYVLQISDAMFKKTSEQPAVGSLFTLNSAGGLEYKIGQVGGVAIGDTIGVEYNGKSVVENGKWKGKQCHDIEFFIEKSGAPRPVAPQQSDATDDLV